MLDLLFAGFMLNMQNIPTPDFSFSGVTSAVHSLPVNLTDAPAPELSAQGAYVFDMDSATVLYEKNPNEVMPIASLTKLMTALLASQNLTESDRVVVPWESRNEDVMYTKTLGLPVGGEFSMGEVMGAMLITSAADAAQTLAMSVDDSEEAFVSRMNDKARDLDLTRTNFEDSFGLSVGDLSTPENLSRLFSYAWRNSLIQKYLTEDSIRLCLEGTSLCYTATTTNILLGQDGVLGGKTGTTDAAGECIVLAVQTPHNKTVLITLLNSDDRFGDARKIISWLNTNFEI